MDILIQLLFCTIVVVFSDWRFWALFYWKEKASAQTIRFELLQLGNTNCNIQSHAQLSGKYFTLNNSRYMGGINSYLILFNLLLDVGMWSFQAHLSVFPCPLPISREMPRPQICSGWWQRVRTSHFLYPVLLFPMHLPLFISPPAPLNKKTLVNSCTILRCFFYFFLPFFSLAPLVCAIWQFKQQHFMTYCINKRVFNFTRSKPQFF